MSGQPSPVRALEVSGAEVCAATGAHLGKLFNELSSNPQQAREHRGAFVVTFSEFGMRDAPAYAAPRVREFCSALDNACQHAVYFFNPDPVVASIRTHLLGLIPIIKSPKGWQYSLRDYIVLTQQHSKHVATFARRISDDANAVLDGLVLNLPVEALVDQPEVRRRVLTAMTPALRAAHRDFASMQFDPRGREILEDIMARGAVLTGVQWDGKIERAVLAKIVALLPAE